MPVAAKCNHNVKKFSIYFVMAKSQIKRLFWHWSPPLYVNIRERHQISTLLLRLQKSLPLLTAAIWHTKLHREQGLESYLVGLIWATGLFRSGAHTDKQCVDQRWKSKSTLLYKILTFSWPYIVIIIRSISIKN